MRTIKFRAWYDNYDMVYNADVTVAKYHKAILMEYTGLKDRNGKDIYESDICSTNGLIAEVIFHRGSFMLRAANTLDFYRGEIEVIGNVFENPELLTK